MIRSLYQEEIRNYGQIRTATEGDNEGCKGITLRAGMTQVYKTAGITGLNGTGSMMVLSLSDHNGDYQDFYLDKPVELNAGVWFKLASLEDGAVVQLRGEAELIEERKTGDRFFVRPRLRVDSLCTLFYQERERGFLFAGESHPMLELTYVDQGSLHSVVDGQDVILNQGDMMLYGPNQWHMQYADIGVAPRFVTISFTLQGEEPKDLYNRKFTSPQKAIGYLQQILRESELGQEGAGECILSLLNLLLVALGRETKVVGKPQLSNSANNENEIIRASQQFIGAHVQQKLSVPMVAKGVDVSPSYLTALFHKHLQISPGEYIRRIKLQQSKQMIREGNLNFTQIAESLQYSTVHHFSRQFKEKFGLTPTEYARSVR